jgi:hypothetical protein
MGCALWLRDDWVDVCGSWPAAGLVRVLGDQKALILRLDLAEFSVIGLTASIVGFY